MHSIAAVLGRIKGEWQKQFSDELILGLSREAQLKWRERSVAPSRHREAVSASESARQRALR